MSEQMIIWCRGRRLSWVDFGGSGATMLALHGSFGRASVFAPLAERLTTRMRLVALDQRGHGMADHGGPFTREEFVADATAVIGTLGLGPVLVLGHSLGGIIAYQLAARYPELVRALVIEDDEMMDVQRHGLGDWWPDWLGSTCPALLLRGARSTLLPSGLAADMVHRRPHTTLVEFPTAGHWIHDDDPDGCANAILNFLPTLCLPTLTR
ncbi:MAG TPA: alpha/beta hydrolase [Pseudonocardiaceae bacterium]|nr:alpha/beta hydrolase [Pseudonocardiaceae bacterium]